MAFCGVDPLPLSMILCYIAEDVNVIGQDSRIISSFPVRHQPSPIPHHPFKPVMAMPSVMRFRKTRNARMIGTVQTAAGAARAMLAVEGRCSGSRSARERWRVRNRTRVRLQYGMRSCPGGSVVMVSNQTLSGTVNIRACPHFCHFSIFPSLCRRKVMCPSNGNQGRRGRPALLCRCHVCVHSSIHETSWG